MASNMDRSLDEILAERKPSRGRGTRGGNSRNNHSSSNNSNNGGGRRRDDRRSARDEYPRDGVRKQSYRDDYEPRRIDEEWVHDRYDDNTKSARGGFFGGSRPDAEVAASGHVSPAGTRLRVENLHYDLTRDDLAGLFGGIGRVLSVKLLYDRAGRSEGVAYVTYADHDDAREAVRQFDGANAKGQPIHLFIVASAKSGGGGGSTAPKPGTGRPLAERVSRPGQSQSQSQSQRRRRQRKNSREEEDDEADDGYDDVDDDAADGDDGRLSVAAAARRGIDRYIPGEGEEAGSRSRSRSPRPARRREGGRRPGQRRRGGGGADGEPRSNGRLRKTQEELDAEMEDYFVSGGGGGGGGVVEATEHHVSGSAPLQGAAAVVDDDADMIG